MDDGAKKDTDKQEFYQVEKICDCKSSRGKKYYFIKWVGYSSKENTWEPLDHLSNVLYMVDEFEQK
jgi:hypothetical protein